MSDNTPSEKIHIGRAILEVLREKGMAKRQFAARLGKQATNINRLFEKESIETALLQQICGILDYDFFRLFTTCPSTGIGSVNAGDGAIIAGHDVSVADALRARMSDKDELIEALRARIADKDDLIASLRAHLLYIEGRTPMGQAQAATTPLPHSDPQADSTPDD